MDRDRRDPNQPGSPGTPASPADARLEEVRQSDLGESRVNEDFLDWLKTKGVNYLLIILIVLVGFIAWIRVKEGRAAKQDAAWVQYVSAVNTAGPEMLEQVAATPSIASVDGIGILARLEAAKRYLEAVRTGRQLRAGLMADQETAPEPAPLDDETREDYLSRADALFTDVVAMDDGSNAIAIHIWTALNGRGTAAEARGDAEAAAGFYTDAADRIEDWYPQLATRSRTFAETAADFSEPVTLPTAAQARAAAAATAPGARPTPVTVDPELESLINPPAADAAGDGADADADAGGDGEGDAAP